MSKFSIVIDTEGSAFRGNRCAEVARLLRRVAERVAYDGETYPEANLVSCSEPLFDLNGNRCGSWTLEARDE